MTTPNHMPSPPIAADLVERDDGLFQIGIGDDAPGPFDSRSFAQAVAEQCIKPLTRPRKNSTRQLLRVVR